jgi:hypothetical protein
MEWFFDLNGSEDVVYLAFLFFGHKYLVYYISENGFANLQPITKETFRQVMNKVKEECEGTTWGLMSKLDSHFPSDDYFGCHLP